MTTLLLRLSGRGRQQRGGEKQRDYAVNSHDSLPVDKVLREMGGKARGVNLRFI